MNFPKTRLTEEAAIRAAEIEKAIENYIYSRPEKFGHCPDCGTGARGVALKKYCRDDVLDALYAEHAALPRETVEVEIEDIDMRAYEDFYGSDD